MVDKPQAEQLKLTQLGKNPRPVLLEAKKVTIPDSKGPALLTTRILVPSSYRSFVNGASKEDTPVSIVMEIAKQIRIPTHLLTGGSWDRVHHKHADFLIGHFRMTEKLSSPLEEVSGTR